MVHKDHNREITPLRSEEEEKKDQFQREICAIILVELSRSGDQNNRDATDGRWPRELP